MEEIGNRGSGDTQPSRNLEVIAKELAGADEVRAVDTDRAAGIGGSVKRDHRVIPTRLGDHVLSETLREGFTQDEVCDLLVEEARSLFLGQVLEVIDGGRDHDDQELIVT